MSGARQTLTVFLEDRVSVGFLRQNRVIAIDVLRTLSRESDVSLQETCVLAWGQIAGYALRLGPLRPPLTTIYAVFPKNTKATLCSCSW